MFHRIDENDEELRKHQSLFERVQLVKRDCLRIGHMLEVQFRRHYVECGHTNWMEYAEEEEKENAGALTKYLEIDDIERIGGFGRGIRHGMIPFNRNRTNFSERIEKADEERRSKISSFYHGLTVKNEQNVPTQKLNKAIQTTKLPKTKALRKSTQKQPTISSSSRRSQSARRPFAHSNGPKWSIPVVRIGPASEGRRRPSSQPSSTHPTTIPEPFQFSQRPPIRCVYSERHLGQMLEERRQEEDGTNRVPIHANPIPPSTYLPDQSHWIGQIRRRNRRPHSVPTPSPPPIAVGQHVPLSTYLRPSPSILELRALRRQRESVAMLAESRGPRGLEEHSIRWRVQQRLHADRCHPPSPRAIFRAQTVPNFHRLQAEFERNLAAHRWVRPSTVPRPFHLSGDDLRGHSCESWSDKDRQRARRERMEAERKRLQKEREGDKPKWK